MKVYISYKLSNMNIFRLRHILANVDTILKKLGHKTFIFMRDVQNFQPGNLDPNVIMEHAKLNLRECDAVLALVQSNEKGEGMLLESGFMKGIGKKLIVANAPNSRAVLLNALADYSFDFSDWNEFEDHLKLYLN